MKHCVIGLTGSMLAGKDFVASMLCAKRISFAFPLYGIARNLLGLPRPHGWQSPADTGSESDTGEDVKAVRGGRQLLQMLGQMGRGEPIESDFLGQVSISYGLREKKDKMTGLEFSGINWDDWGTPAIWVDAAIRRALFYIQIAKTPSLFCFTNLRFPNELRAVRRISRDDIDVRLMHVWASEASRVKRAKDGPQAALVTTYPPDISELLAHVFNKKAEAWELPGSVGGMGKHAEEWPDIKCLDFSTREFWGKAWAMMHGIIENDDESRLDWSMNKDYMVLFSANTFRQQLDLQLGRGQALCKTQTLR